MNFFDPCQIKTQNILLKTFQKRWILDLQTINLPKLNQTPKSKTHTIFSHTFITFAAQKENSQISKLAN
jgi:hypothetical protein